MRGVTSVPRGGSRDHFQLGRGWRMSGGETCTASRRTSLLVRKHRVQRCEGRGEWREGFTELHVYPPQNTRASLLIPAVEPHAGTHPLLVVQRGGLPSKHCAGQECSGRGQCWAGPWSSKTDSNKGCRVVSPPALPCTCDVPTLGDLLARKPI